MNEPDWRQTTYVAAVDPLELDRVEQIAFEAVAEVGRQDQLARAGKFGGTHILPSGPDWARYTVLAEEVGEVAKELNEGLMRPEGTDHGNLRKELIQTAACALAWAAALDEGR